MVDHRRPSADTDQAAARQRSVDAALHSTRMEGLETTAESKLDAEDYVAGRIDVDDLVTRTRARYGLTD